MSTRRVFITGGTGYMGRTLASRLIEGGDEVTLLVRPGSASKAAKGARVVFGNALDAATFMDAGAGSDTFVHLVGVAHPAPWKEHAFRAIDLASVRTSVRAAKHDHLSHFVYVSVAQPAPVMRAYQSVRRECEQMIRATGIPATFLRPWYVLGPGHRWPVILKPLYALAESISSTRETARRLGLVTLEQMVAALVWAVENPPDSVRILDVPEIRRVSPNVRDASLVLPQDRDRIDAHGFPGGEPTRDQGHGD
jgi:uncharacterized protein YbjT (DUF2867 family)